MNTSKKGIRPLAFILILIMTACTSAPQPQPDNNKTTIVDSETGEEIVIDSGGTIAVSMGMPKTLNPLENCDLREDKVLSLIFRPLFTLGDEQELVPVLAQDYILSADGRTMSIVLKNGLKWSDGEPITAEDVIFSLQTIKNAAPDSIYKPAMANVASCYQSSELVTVINYSEPYGGCAYNLCFPIIPRHHYRKGNDFLPLGSGCYKMTEFNEKRGMKLEACATEKGMPYIGNVNVIFAPDTKSDSEAFQTGLTDVYVTDLSAMGKMDINRPINYVTYNSNRFEFIGFNFDQPVLQNRSFRQGLAYGLPLKDIVTDIYVGNAAKSITPINPASALSAPAGLENYAYNPELAQNMLAASGYDMSKLTLSLLVNNDNTERVRIANIIKDALKDYGITVNVEAVDYDTYLGRLKRGDFQLYIGGTEFTPRVEPSALLSIGGSINYGKYKDMHMNELLSACQGALGDENYKRSVRELQNYCAQQLPCIGIAFKSDVLLTSGRIKGEKKPTMTDIFNNVEQWYISEE